MTSKKRPTVENSRFVAATFRLKVKMFIKVHHIRRCLVLNLDEYSQSIIPAYKYTLAPKGSKIINNVNYNDKRNISGCLAIALNGNFLPCQLIYKGKTNRCFQKNIPSSVKITRREDKSWANSETVIHFISNIIIPYVNEQRLHANEKCLLIMDVFKSHLMANVLHLLKNNGISVIFVPPGMTGELQALDVGIIKPWKDRMRSEFAKYESIEMQRQKKQAFVKNRYKSAKSGEE